MATPGSELVQLQTIVGPEAYVRNALVTLERRGVLRGTQMAIAKLPNGRAAVKVWVVGNHDPGKPSVPPSSPKRWSLSPGQTFALFAGVGVLGIAGTIVWMIVHTVFAVGHAIGQNPGPIVGGLIVIALLALFIGGGGGGTFTGTFKGTWR